MNADVLKNTFAGLNPEQREAVEYDDGPLLVLAGAGSGKTRVITVRIAHLISRRLDPRDVLALTFTNKAAGEMAERVAELVGEEASRQITVGTFHSLGLRMLEEDGKAFGVPRGFTLMDAADQASAVRQCLRGLGLDPQRHDPRLFLQVISNLRNQGQSPGDASGGGEGQMTARVYRAYLEWKEAYRSLDFDDLILRPVEGLQKDAALREKWTARFRTVLVDEYQDTNAMQLALVQLLSQEHQSVCVVGDDDQSIYGWRGAQIENILGFESSFPGARTIKLTQNYRSTGHILACSNQVIQNNTARKAKELWTDQGDGEKPRVVLCKDGGAEASFVASRIWSMHEREHVPLSHMGVLFRASSQAAAFEEAFRLAGIRYKLVGAFDFFQRKEIKDLLSYLKIVDNPRDKASLVRIINFPRRGIGPKTLGALMDYAESRSMSPFRALANASDISGVPDKAAGAMMALHAAIKEGQEHLKQHRNLASLANFLCERVGARTAWIRDPQRDRVVRGDGGPSNV